jgi:hypothetical protein
MVSSLIKLQFQPRRCAAQTCNDLFNIFAPSLDRPVWCGAVCHGSDIAGLVRELNEFCFTAFLRRALDLLTLAPSINQRRFGHVVGINCQSGFCLCLCLSDDRDGRGAAPSSFRRERPRANAEARSRRPPMGRHSRSMGGLKGVRPTSHHPGGCQRSQLAPGKPGTWPLVQLF